MLNIKILDLFTHFFIATRIITSLNMWHRNASADSYKASMTDLSKRISLIRSIATFSFSYRAIAISLISREKRSFKIINSIVL